MNRSFFCKSVYKHLPSWRRKQRSPRHLQPSYDKQGSDLGYLIMATVRRIDSIWVELSYRQVRSQQTVEATSGHGTVLLQSHTHTQQYTRHTPHADSQRASRHCPCQGAREKQQPGREMAGSQGGRAFRQRCHSLSAPRQVVGRVTG